MSEALRDQVRVRYGAVASSGPGTDGAAVQAIAHAFGYSAEELAAIPVGANLGLSCGNPTATAGLRPGEVVVDLGCGAGLDVFLAAGKVGPTGKAIGIDMTDEMLELAWRNAARGGPGGHPIENVEFHRATIDQLPLADRSVDCVISNCVINLAEDKPAVFREMVRVLRSGGRLAISDIALRKPLPPELSKDVMAYVGCIAGAILIDDYRRQLVEAGFAAVEVVETGADLNAYGQVEGQSVCCPPAMSELPVLSSECCGPTLNELPTLQSGCCSPSEDSGSVTAVHAGLRELLSRYDLNEYAASVRIYALRP